MCSHEVTGGCPFAAHFVRLLAAAGHDAIHTINLPAQNRSSDTLFNDCSVREQRVVITKDTDFHDSHLLHGRPWKLLLVRTGNIRTRELRELFQQHLPAVIAALEQSSLVELHRATVRPLV